jgi:B12 binding domain
MRVRMILPALTEATSPLFRPIKYSLFPPLGLATLASFLDPCDDVIISDEHVEKLAVDDEPNVVVIQVYITSARRAYEIADGYRSRGVYVCLGGLHVTSLPEEAAKHADTIFLGPGEDTWPQFLADYRARSPRPRYESKRRTLVNLPPIRRDLIKRHLYLVPNSIVVSRGCPHVCDFCYKVAFFKGGKQFYTQAVDDALAEIERLPGRHLYFLDDHLFGNPRFASSLFDGMRGMGRLWQAAGTVKSVLETSQLLDKAVTQQGDTAELMRMLASSRDCRRISRATPACDGPGWPGYRVTRRAHQFDVSTRPASAAQPERADRLPHYSGGGRGATTISRFGERAEQGPRELNKLGRWTGEPGLRGWFEHLARRRGNLPRLGELP